MALKLAVIGDPVDHSASPALHREFLKLAGTSGTYEAIRVGAGTAAHEIARLRAAGYTGLNVTTPLKEEAFAYVDSLDAIARASGAVNTIVFSQRRVRGYNTDGIGALGALKAAGLASVLGARVLVLGAGPTARATIAALVAAGARTFVWNRTVEKAEATSLALGAELWRADGAVEAVFATLSPGVVLSQGALRSAVVAAPVIVDANYATRSTLGADLGRDVATGMAMLEASARASFDLFCGTVVHDVEDHE